MFVVAGADEVWAALTDVDRQRDWNVAAGLALGSRPGDRVAWGSAEGPVIEGEILSVDPAARRLAHTFRFTFADETSTVAWELTAGGPVCRVRVHHDLHDAPGTRQIIGPDGWPQALSRLKTLLEQGKPAPWFDDPEG